MLQYTINNSFTVKSYYRNITLQMGMSKEYRDPADILTSCALKEYERLQLEAPSISEKSIVTFKNFQVDGERTSSMIQVKFSLSMGITGTIEGVPCIQRHDGTVKHCSFLVNLHIRSTFFLTMPCALTY